MLGGARGARIVAATTIFRRDGGRGDACGRTVEAMRDALLDRDAELAALADRLELARPEPGA